MIVRGGGAQNLAAATPRGTVLDSPDFQKPRGGVDFFIGDPLSRHNDDAASPTGLTVIQFESQSDQFLDTFDHISASASRTPFYPTVLQGVSHKTTIGNARAPESVVWLGPGMTVSGDTAISSRASTLTLVGCIFAGRRPDTPDTPPVMAMPGVPRDLPTGAVVVDSSAFLVGDVGTRLTYPAPAIFYSRLGGTIAATPLEGTMRPVWLRSM